jgi:hypothetical protein
LRKKYLLFISLFLIVLAGCNHADDNLSEEANMDNTFYFGKGTEWFGTYTVSMVHESYFESLYIQHVTDRTGSNEGQIKDIREIEYVLNMGGSKLESSDPQPLKGIGNFHTATEINKDLVDGDFPDQLTLTVKWNDQSEVIELKKQD